MAEGSEEMRSNTVLALVAVVAGFVLGLILAWIYRMQGEEERSRASASRKPGERITLELQPLRASEAETSVEVEPEPESDDLTRVEGIGPKMSRILVEAGIGSFDQLAASEPDDLRQLLREEGLPFADPSTWPEQASLAAAGAWDTLEGLQDELSGGRRVG